MSDLLEATTDKITRKVDGVDRTFHVLSAYDRAALLRADRKNRRDALTENLKIGGITGLDAFGELQRFDEERSTEQTWIGFVNDPEHTFEIALASLAVTHGAEAESIAKRVVIDLATKATLCGLSVVSQEDPPLDPKTSSVIPPVYGTPETSSTGPTPGQS